MALGKKQKLQIAAALLAAAILTAGAFFYAVMAGVFTAGFLTTCGFILYDRVGRRLWEKSVSFHVKRLEQTQDRMATDLARTGNQIAALKDHVTDTVISRRETFVETATDATLPPPRKRAGRNAAPAEEDSNMPLAVKPGMSSGRSYDDIISGQHQLSDMAVREVVNDALRHERIDVFLQPIVRLPQRKVRFYEMFARVRARPGFYLSAARYLKVAQESMFMRDIDKLLLAECLEIIRETAQMERAAPFFINISPSSLKNATFINRLLAFLGKHRDLAPRMVFEFTQDEFKKLKAPLMEVIKGLGQLGCSFSIDNVTDLNFDIGALLKLRVRYVKIAAADLVPRAGNEKMFTETLKLKRRLEGNGISVIAEKIETERALKELLDFDINYGQGYLFGRPDLQGAYAERKEPHSRNRL